MQTTTASQPRFCKENGANIEKKRQEHGDPSPGREIPLVPAPECQTIFSIPTLIFYFKPFLIPHSLVQFKIVNTFLVILLLMRVHLKKANQRSKHCKCPVSFCSNIWVFPLHIVAFYLEGRCLLFNIPFTCMLPTQQSFKHEGIWRVVRG